MYTIKNPSTKKQHQSIRKPSTTADTSTFSHFLHKSQPKLQTLGEKIERETSFGTTPHLARMYPLTSGVRFLSYLTRNSPRNRPNLKQNIDGHDKSILRNKIVPSRSCNCRAKIECPMSGNCLKKLVVY